MNKNSLILSALPLVMLMASCATQPPVSSQSNAAEISQVARGEPFTYDDYASVLATYVNSEGEVDYATLKENRDALDRFNADLGALDRATYESWTESQQIAFWINAYNSLTLQAIIDNYPVESIRDISGVWTRLNFTVLGEAMTLDHIEHGILRKDFNEPRIHMGLVCASIGCPLLRAEPFVGDRLATQLDEQTVEFLSYARNFRLDRDSGEVLISSIFKWFGEDWKTTYGTEEKFEGFNDEKRAVLNFIAEYVDEGDRSYMTEGEYKLKYLDYDWGLNNQ